MADHVEGHHAVQLGHHHIHQHRIDPSLVASVGLDGCQPAEREQDRVASVGYQA